MGDKKDTVATLEPMANTTSQGKDLANKISAFFQSVAAHLPPLTEGCSYLTNKLDVPDRYIISVDEVEQQLARLNTRKATGPDEIPAWVLRDFAPFLAAPL